MFMNHIQEQLDKCHSNSLGHGNDILIFQNDVIGAGEMSWQLRRHTAFAEDPHSIPCTHIVAHNHLKLQLLGM